MSTDDLHRRADELFDAAMDLPREEQKRLLDRECLDQPELRALVEKLLGHMDEEQTLLEAGRGLEGLELTEAAGDSLSSPHDLSGEIVERYRVVREIGRGGMAVVYEAERADGQFEQTVALKVMQSGLFNEEAVRRFERERQILAHVKHPNIAKLLDGGTAQDGRPFLVMELIDGLPIDRYCDQNQLTLRERLALFVDVASAVAHAHQSLVVHRDIKPNNILVSSDGQAHLLDFGIARPIAHDEGDDLTRTGRALMTPRFASPEQLRSAPVTAASDIYQLGVLLYLLLTGRMPYANEGSDSILLIKAICEDDPTRPSSAVGTGSAPAQPEQVDTQEIAQRRRTSPASLRRSLTGDLDNILLVALRKEPERRYLSASQLVADVQAYLDGHPVSARPDTFWYRSSKFIRRNRIAVGFAATTVLALAGLAVTASVQATRIAGERDRANVEAETAHRVTEFMVDLFKVSNPGKSRGNSVTAREVLDEGANRISEELEDQPAVRARMMDTIGRVYQNLGLYGEAQPLLQGALDLRSEHLGSEHTDTVTSVDHVAWILEEQGKYDEAEPLYRRALERRIAEFGNDHPETASALNNLGLLMYRTGDLGDETERLLQESLDIRRRHLEADDPEIGSSLNNLGLLFHKRDDLDRAEAMYRESLEVREAGLGDDHPHVALALDNLGRLLYSRKDLDGAGEMFRRGLEIRKKILPEGHPDLSTSMNNLASVMVQNGDLAGSIPIFREVVAIDKKALGDQHPKYATSLGNLATVIMRSGDPAGAEPYYREALAIVEKAHEPSSHHVGFARGHLGGCLIAQGRVREAEPLARSSYEILLASLGLDHRRTKSAKERLDSLN